MYEGTCSVTDCERPIRVKSRGWCAIHYQRWQKYGDPLGHHPSRPPMEGRKFSRLTVVEFNHGRGEWECACDCGRITYARRNQLTQGIKQSCGTTGPCHWRAEGWVKYDTMHKRLGRARGLARQHTCVDCGKRAAHWSYDHQDPNEVTEELRGCVVPYSLNLSHYDPRCKTCHRRFDVAHHRDDVVSDTLSGSGYSVTPHTASGA